MKDIDGVETDDLEVDDLEITPAQTEEAAEETIADLILGEVTEAQQATEEVYPEDDETTEAEQDPYDGYEEDDDEDDEEDRISINPLKIILVMLVMAVLAFLITVVIWNYKHPENPVKKVLAKRPAVTVETLLPEYITDVEAPVASTSSEAKTLTGDETETEDEEEIKESQEAEVVTVEGDKVKTKDGHVFFFHEKDDYVTAKDYVNMRTEPSTGQGDKSVVGKLENGTVVHRTGISSEGSWSRIEKGTQILYVSTSYLVAAEDVPTETTE